MKSTEKTSPHKWLIVSALQKSIRMGQSDLALSHAQYLFETDRSYHELPATKARAYSWGFLFQRTLHN